MAGRMKRGSGKGTNAGSSGDDVWGDPSDPRDRRHAEIVMTAMQALKRGDVEGANAGFRLVLNENIEHPDALHGMGLLAQGMGRFETAAELVRRAIAIRPNGAGYWSNLGNIYQNMEQWEDAVAAHKEAVKHNPRHSGVRQNLGSVLNLVNQPFAAMPHFREAMKLDPTSIDATASYAITLARIGDYGPSNRFFRQALELNRADPVANFSYGANLLWQGRWAEGWPLYEWRLFMPSMAGQMPRFSIASTLPEDLTSKRVLLLGEQGIGDEIRHATMIAEVIARGADVTLQCAVKLVPLFARSFPGVQVIPKPVGGLPEDVSSYDLVSTTTGLGKYLRTDAARFPEVTDLLKPDPLQVAAFRERLAALGPGLKVGLCWRSRMTAISRTLRGEYQIGITDLEPLLRLNGVTFINLQYDECSDELAEIKDRFGVTVHAFDDVDLFDDLDSSAALTRACDIIVSANTSVATIAGGVGVPTIEFHGRSVPEGFPINGHDPWFASVRPVGKRMADKWSRTMRTIAASVRDAANGASLDVGDKHGDVSGTAS